MEILTASGVVAAGKVAITEHLKWQRYLLNSYIQMPWFRQETPSMCFFHVSCIQSWIERLCTAVTGQNTTIYICALQKQAVIRCHLLFFRSIYFAVFLGTCAPFRKLHWASTTEKQQIIAQGQEWAMANHPKLGSCSDLKFEVQVWRRRCPVLLQLSAGEANLLRRKKK